MAKEAKVTKPRANAARKKERVRILNAARRVLQGADADDISFEEVARESGLEMEIIARHFQSKNELLLSLAADTLSTLARTPAPKQVDEISDTADALQWLRIAESIVAPRPVSDRAPMPAKFFAAQGASEPSPERANGLRKKGFLTPDLASVLADVAPKELQQDGSLGSVKRIERRLQILEHTLSDLGERHERERQNHTVDVSLVQESISSLSDRISGFEKQSRDAVANLRAVVTETAMRAFAATPAPETAPTDWRSEILILDEVLEDNAVIPEKSATPANSPPSYLLMARRAANVAAEHMAIVGRIPPRFRPQAEILRRARPVALAGLVLAILALAAWVAFNRGVADAATVSPSMAVSSKHAARQRTTSDPLLQLANTGNRQAALLLGLNYLEAKDGTKNETEAARWLQSAALQGNAVAQYWLGTLYAHGRGVAANDVEALRWFKASAEAGNVKAMNSLARIYATGPKRDATEAAHWFAQAAVLGYVTAQFNLAILYERGTGVPQSRLDAYMWYAVASAAGDAESKMRVQAMGSELSATERQAAEGAAKAFTPAPLNTDANELPNLMRLAAR